MFLIATFAFSAFLINITSVRWRTRDYYYKWQTLCNIHSAV